MWNFRVGNNSSLYFNPFKIGLRFFDATLQYLKCYGSLCDEVLCENKPLAIFVKKIHQRRFHNIFLKHYKIVLKQFESNHPIEILTSTWKRTCQFLRCRELCCFLVLYVCQSLTKLAINDLTLSRRGPLSHRNRSIDLLRKSVDWFLYNNSLRLERVKMIFI